MTDIKKMNENDMEQVNGGNFFADLEEVLRQIFADEKPTQQNNPKFANPKFANPKLTRIQVYY